MKENCARETLKDSPEVNAQLEGPIEASLNDNAEHNRDRELVVSKKIKTIGRLESEGLLEMDVIVEAAKSVFHQTIQQTLEPMHKLKKPSSDSIAPIGVACCFEDEADMTASTRDMNAAFGCSTRRLRTTRLSDGNPPLSDDEDRVEETRASNHSRPRREEHLGVKLNNQTCSLRPRRLFRRKSKEPRNSSTTKHAKKEGKRPGRFSLFRACFGGGFYKEDKNNGSARNNEQLDAHVIPSRQQPNGHDCTGHRYSRRQAFIHTMMESQLESQRNRRPL